MAEVYKVSVSKARQRLIELLQSINFGSIENLHVDRGDPIFTPPPRITRDVKLGANSDNGPRPELNRNNFKLRAAVIELFDILDEVQTGVIPLIEARNGLPVRVLFHDCFNV
jgi:hypothetical protein